MKLSRVGVDLAKNVYQLHGVDRHGKTVWKRRLRRGQWLQVLTDNVEPGCEIGMEACANYRGRIYVRSRATFAESNLLAMRRSPYTDIRQTCQKRVFPSYDP